MDEKGISLNIGIRAHDIDIRDNIFRLTEELGETKVSNIQLSLAKSFPKLSRKGEYLNFGMCDEIKKRLGKKDISISVLGCYENIIHPDIHKRQRVLNKIKYQISYSSFLDACTVATETGNMDAEIHFTPNNFTDKAYGLVESSVAELVSFAEEKNVNFAIEPGLNHPIFSVRTASRLIRSINSDRLKIIIDPSNLINAESIEKAPYILEEAFEEFGDQICAVHVKDFNKKNGKLLNCGTGKGIVDVKRMLQYLEINTPYMFTILDELPTNEVVQSVLYARETAYM